MAGALALVVAAGAADLAKPPNEQLSTRLAVATIEAYQATLSPLLLRAGVRCRFHPSCSHYGAAVLRRDGLLAGGVRAAWRVLRCGPWTPAGTEDPP